MKTQQKLSNVKSNNSNLSNTNKKSPTPIKLKKAKTPIRTRNLPRELTTETMTTISNQNMMSFDEWMSSEKVKKEYIKKYKKLETEISILKVKEKEMKSIMTGMKRRENQINDAKTKKYEYYNTMKKEKENKQKMFDRQKLNLQLLKDYEDSKLRSIKEINAKKKLMLKNINKAEQNLIKSKYIQSITSRNKYNKDLHDKIKQHYLHYKQNIINKKEQYKSNKLINNKINYDSNLNTTEHLKHKCKQLEILQNKYKNSLKSMVKKSSDMNHPINYLNHTFNKLNTFNTDQSTFNLTSGAYIHSSPMKIIKDYCYNRTPERSTIYDSKTFRTCKTPLSKK